MSLGPCPPAKVSESTHMAEKTQLLRKNLPTVNCAPGEGGTSGTAWGVIEGAAKGGWHWNLFGFEGLEANKKAPVRSLSMVNTGVVIACYFWSQDAIIKLTLYF